MSVTKVLGDHTPLKWAPQQSPQNFLTAGPAVSKCLGQGSTQHMWVVPFWSSGCAHVVRICVFNSSRRVCHSSFTSRFIADHSHVEKRTKCDA